MIGLGIFGWPRFPAGEMIMTRWIWLLIAGAGLGSFLVAQPVSAQQPGPYVRPQANPGNPYSQPVFSPYLNLGRNGTNPAIDYYGIVRPQQEFSSSIQQLQSQETANYATLAAGQYATPGGPLPTGIRSQYMNFSHYYGGTVARTATLPPLNAQPAVSPAANQGSRAPTAHSAPNPAGK
jgi:hypothetical protein